MPERRIAPGPAPDGNRCLRAHRHGCDSATTEITQPLFRSETGKTKWRTLNRLSVCLQYGYYTMSDGTPPIPIQVSR
jgi:hypothetical protein